MNRAVLRWSPFAVGVLLVTGLLGGCAAYGGYGYPGGYGYNGGFAEGIGADYYEPFGGGGYGGWNRGYNVGPFRGGRGFHRGGGFARPGGHAFRSAAGGHGVPFVPTGHGRGGGGGGGGRNGGR